MKIHYLGTAAAEGWPGVFCQCEACRLARAKGGKNIRTRSSLLIDDAYLLDLPPDTYLHALREGLELGKIRHLLVTHSHPDHFYPEELAMYDEPFAHLEAESQLELWGNAQVTGMLQGKRIGPCKTHTIKAGDTFQAGKLTVTALRADHMGTEEEALLYLISDGTRRIFHAHDSGWYPEATWEALAGTLVDLVNFDCTCGPLSCRRGHMGFPEILEAREKLLAIGAAGPETKFVITHFSHNGGMLHAQLEEHVADKGFIVAYDGMVLKV